MTKFKITWYTMEEEVKIEEIDAESEMDATRKAYEKYGGTKNAPAPCISVVKI